MQIRRIRFTVIWALMILLTSSGAPAQDSLSLTVKQAQNHLLQLKVAGTLSTDTPTDVRAGIGEFKKMLALHTDAIVSKFPSTVTVVYVKQQLERVMPASSVGKVSEDQWTKWNADDLNKPVAGLYGGELTISVKQPKPSLLLVQETFDIACGSDNILLVYSNAGGKWNRLLLWQSKPYTSIGEAFGDTYETLLLRPEHNGHPMLLVVHGTPWCTSTMSKFAMDIFELRNTSDSIPMWHGEHDYRRADEDPPLTLRSTVNGFEIRTSVSSMGERTTRKGERYAVVSRKGVIRYAVVAGSVRRVEPIAINARDSVEEWLQMPRSEAIEFADEPDGSLTWKMFQEFSYEGKSFDANLPLPGVDAVFACKGEPSHFQAEVTSEIFDPLASGSRSGPAYFVQVQQVSNGYRIHKVTLSKDSACGGQI